MPAAVVTETIPVVPPATTAVMVVGLTTVNDVAAVPPKLTDVAPLKLAPVNVTVCPLPVSVGVNNVIIGAAAGDMVKADPLVAVPPGVVTVILPVEPLATTAVILVALITV